MASCVGSATFQDGDMEKHRGPEEDKRVDGLQRGLRQS